MKALPTWWIRKAAALAVLTGLVLAVWIFAIVPARDAYSYYWTKIATTEELLARYTRIAARKATLEAQTAELREGLGVGRFYYAGGDLDVIAAELQQKLTRMIAESGSQLKTAQILSLPGTELYWRVGLRVRFAAPVESLQQILHDVENLRPYLFTDSLEVQVGRAMLRDALGPANSKNVDGFLEISMDLSAYSEEIPQ